MENTPKKDQFFVAKNPSAGYFCWEVRNGLGEVINSFHLKYNAVKTRKAFERHNAQEK